MRPRLLIIGAKEIITGSLGSPLDQIFDQLHSAYFGNGSLPWDTLLAAAIKYFDDNKTLAAAHDAFFPPSLSFGSLSWTMGDWI